MNESIMLDEWEDDRGEYDGPYTTEEEAERIAEEAFERMREENY